MKSKHLGLFIITCLFIGCQTVPKSSQNSETATLIGMADAKSLGLSNHYQVAIRVGSKFCNGLIYEKRLVVTNVECVGSGQQIILRTYKNPRQEISGVWIYGGGLKYAVIEAAEDLDGDIFPHNKIVKSKLDRYYFFDNTKRSWVLKVDGEKRPLFDMLGDLDPLTTTGSPMFSPKGDLVGLIPHGIEDFHRDVGQKSFRSPSLWDGSLMQASLGVNFVAFRRENHKFGLSPRFTFEESFTIRSWKNALGFTIGPKEALYVESSYNFDFVNSYDDRLLSITPGLGFMEAAPYAKIGLNYGKFRVEFLYQKKPASDYLQLGFNPFAWFL